MIDEQRYLEIVSGKEKSVTACMHRAFFRALSVLYGCIVWLRNRMFDLGIKRTEEVSRPVISIGNLTTGGTGKTPVVAHVAGLVEEIGLKPAIVSRGYRSIDGEENDEKRVLEILCPNVPHVQNRDRVAAANSAISDHASELIVADDAFQHRRLHRDLNIVLIDALNPWGHGFVLPRGLLRESKRQLRRADLVVVTRADQVAEETRAQLWTDIRAFKPQEVRIEVTFLPNRAIAVDGKSMSVEELLAETEGRVQAFCGIGNPEAFRQTIEQASFELSDFRAFPDHHHYSEKDLSQLLAVSESSQRRELGDEHEQPGVILTTLKDLVKIDSNHRAASQIWALDIATTFLTGENEFRAAVSNLCGGE
jgi:tetraacyldisaccharide 4'-kinase